MQAQVKQLVGERPLQLTVSQLFAGEAIQHRIKSGRAQNTDFTYLFDVVSQLRRQSRPVLVATNYQTTFSVGEEFSDSLNHILFSKLVTPHDICLPLFTSVELAARNFIRIPTGTTEPVPFRHRDIDLEVMALESPSQMPYNTFIAVAEFLSYKMEGMLFEQFSQRCREQPLLLFMSYLSRLIGKSDAASLETVFAPENDDRRS